MQTLSVCFIEILLGDGLIDRLLTIKPPFFVMTTLKMLIAFGSACLLYPVFGSQSIGMELAGLSLGELMDLEVSTPGKVSETIRETPASVYLIGRKDIETHGYRNLTEVLENVPGFYNINNYEGVSGNFGVRGYWNGRSQNGSVAFLLNE